MGRPSVFFRFCLSYPSVIYIPRILFPLLVSPIPDTQSSRMGSSCRWHPLWPGSAFFLIFSYFFVSKNLVVAETGKPSVPLSLRICGFPFFFFLPLARPCGFFFFFVFFFFLFLLGCGLSKPEGQSAFYPLEKQKHKRRKRRRRRPIAFVSES